VDGKIYPEDKPEEKAVVKAPVKKERPRKEFKDEDLARVVDQLPLYPGGTAAFKEFIDKMSREMTTYLEKDQTKTYIMMDFIIDKDGKPAYAKVLNGGNDLLNEKLELLFEAMPNWSPAMKGSQPVAMKLKQTISIERPEPVSLDLFSGSGDN
jgi:hypothetical protein